MSNITSPAETTQLVEVAVASDFACATANMAATLTRSWSEAQEAIARDLANTGADLEARFEEIARITLAAVGPGTMMGDYLILVGERATQREKEMALERLARALGGSLLLPPEKGGLRPRARQALRLLARDKDVPQKEILRQEIPVAVLAALAAFDENQKRRDGWTWRKDEHGKLLHFTPTEIYCIPDLRGPARDHLRDLMRGCLEAELIEHACLTDADDYLVSQSWDEIEERGHWRDDSTAAREVDDAVTAKEHDDRATPLRSTASAEDVLLDAALVQRIRLAPRERQVVALLELEPREIAKKLGIAEATVSVLKGRALNKIFDNLNNS
jgi:DNA-binding CsgD family transcriptional regulator